MTTDEIRNILSEKKEYLHRKYGVSSLGIFGSFSQGNHDSTSDLDLLVEFDRPIGLQFIDLAEELEAFLGMKVDLVTKRSLNPHLRSSIVSDIINV
jgi:predicted nucleotidyltransferase